MWTMDKIHKKKSRVLFSILQTSVHWKIIENFKDKKEDDEEFKNKPFEFLYEENDIFHDMSCRITPQQHIFKERKYISLQEVVITIINKKNVANNLWGRVINTTLLHLKYDLY